MMSNADRRTFLKMLGGGAAAAAASGSILRALANPPDAKDEFFMFIHAQGGGDVTLWSDPRNENKGLADPATTKPINTAAPTQWKDDSTALDPSAYSSVPGQPPR